MGGNLETAAAFHFLQVTRSLDEMLKSGKVKLRTLEVGVTSEQTQDLYFDVEESRIPTDLKSSSLSLLFQLAMIQRERAVRRLLTGSVLFLSDEPSTP